MSNLHPVHSVTDGFINSFNRHKIDLHNPDHTKITVEEIANNLSKICRFGGAIKPFYSVAQHSLLVAHLAPPHLFKAALLHDAPEAFVGDVIKPIKVLLGESYQQMELAFERAICQRFNLSMVDLLQVKPFDKQACEIEYEYFFKDNQTAMPRLFNNGDGDPCWPHEIAAEIFASQLNSVV